jgi:hypothetical protein
MRQARVHAAQNRTQRSRLRSALKKVRTATGAELETAFAEAVQLLDRAGRKHLIHLTVDFSGFATSFKKNSKNYCVLNIPLLELVPIAVQTTTYSG